MAFTRSQLGSLSRKSGLDDKPTRAFRVPLERELDTGHLCVTLVGLPSERESLRWLDGLDHAAAAAAWASRTVPCKDNFSAWPQIDAGLRAEPGAELVRLRQSRPDPRWRYG